MSIRLMSAAWEMDIPAAEKMVLLCLCDHANDNGDCWPSMDRMARKCSVSERTVYRTIKQLEKRGIITIKNKAGSVNQYRINPCHLVTPDTVSPLTLCHKPLTQCHPTPDTVSPEPLKNHKEPPKKAAPVVAPVLVLKPEAVPVAVWDDFVSLRKSKRSPLTATAMAGIQREAEKAGWSLPDALEECVTRGWQAFKADWVKRPKASTHADPFGNFL